MLVHAKRKNSFPHHSGSIYVLAGDLLINNKEITRHDFIKISNIEKISIKIVSESKLFILSSPLNVSYETYK